MKTTRACVSDRAQKLAPNFTALLAPEKANLLLKLFAKLDDQHERIAEHESLWQAPDVVDRVVRLAEVVLSQMGISPALNNYFSKVGGLC